MRWLSKASSHRYSSKDVDDYGIVIHPCTLFKSNSKFLRSNSLVLDLSNQKEMEG